MVMRYNYFINFPNCIYYLEQPCIKVRDHCDNNTDCCPMGNWPGGRGNCYNGLCDCRINVTCNEDKQCCSGKCKNGGCEKDIGDICTIRGTVLDCKPGLVCNIPSLDPIVAHIYKKDWGTCEDKDYLTSACIGSVGRGKSILFENVYFSAVQLEV